MSVLGPLNIKNNVFAPIYWYRNGTMESNCTMAAFRESKSQPKWVNSLKTSMKSRKNDLILNKPLQKIGIK